MEKGNWNPNYPKKCQTDDDTKLQDLALTIQSVTLNLVKSLSKIIIPIWTYMIYDPFVGVDVDRLLCTTSWKKNTLSVAVLCNKSNNHVIKETNCANQIILYGRVWNMPEQGQGGGEKKSTLSSR